MARATKRQPEQLPLDYRPRTRGGARVGAGRKPSPGRRSVPHRARPKHRASYPLHVTMRTGIRGLRTDAVFARVREAIACSSKERDAFRVVHFSVQDNHLHLLVEAKDKQELTRGMRGLAVRAARRINGVLRRRGQVFSERYHARELTRPRAVRNALVYILHNHRKHGVSVAWLDPRSSAHHFDGWRRDVLLEVARSASRAGPPPHGPVVAPAKTWLASVGWRRAGLLGLDESPAKPG